MHQIDIPEHVSDPFPEGLGVPMTMIYTSDLALMRFKESIQTGNGNDVAYVVERDYPLKYTLGSDRDIREITVPAGMLTDLASVPWFARWLVGRVGRHLEAAIVHDYLYVARKWEPDPKLREAKRKFADQLFYVGMRDAGVYRIVAWIMYVTVRIFGQWFSDKNESGHFLDIHDPEVAARLHPRDEHGDLLV